MQTIRTAIWDCDNVMWFHKTEQVQIIAKELGIKEVEQLSTQFFNMIYAFNKKFVTKRVTLKDTYNIIENEMPILFFYNITPIHFLNVWTELKFKINDFNEDVLSVMEYLSSKGIKCIIKTDWWRDVQVSMLKEFGIIDYIERIYCCDNSFLKYNPLSISEIIVPGREKEYIMIGDSLTSDICFANNAGIKSIWFNRGGIQKNDTSYKPTYEISSLLEISKII